MFYVVSLFEVVGAETRLLNEGYEITQESPLEYIKPILQ